MDVNKSIQNGFSDIACKHCQNGLPPNWRDELASISTLQSSAICNQSCIAPEFKKPSKSKRKKVIKEESQELNSPVTVIPLIHKDMDDPQPGIRRSSRIRIPPLPFWKNEYLRINEKTGTTELIMGSSNTTLPKAVKKNVNKEELPENIKEEESVIQHMPPGGENELAFVENNDSAFVENNDSAFVENNDSAVIQSNENDPTFVQTSLNMMEDESFFVESSIEKVTNVEDSVNSNRVEFSDEESMQFNIEKDDVDHVDPPPRKKKKSHQNQSKWTEEEIAQLREIAEEETVSTNKEAYEEMSRRVGKTVNACKEACHTYHIRIKSRFIDSCIL